MSLCPYCKIRPVIRKTCGSLQCMHDNRMENIRKWWKKNGSIYRGKHYSKDEGAKLCTRA